MFPIPAMCLVHDAVTPILFPEQSHLHALAVNVMEEVISDDDEAAPKKGKMNSRQHKADKRKRGLQYPEG